MQLLLDGCSVSELASLFNKDKRTVSERIRNVKPSGDRNGFPIYHLAEASKYLCDPVVNVEEYIKQLRPQDLPPYLMKEFWLGQLTKQKFELNDAKLWLTEDVMRVLANVFKNLKTGILLFADTIEAKTDLTDKQRRLLNELSDGLLIELHRTLIEGDIDADVKPKRQADDVLDA